MGAPMGHPFFGNQYTNGGYITGSFTYKVAEKSADAEIVKSVVSDVNNSIPHKTIASAVHEQTPSDFILSTFEKKSNKGIGKKHLIFAGIVIVTVAVVGGVLTYRHINKKSKAKKEGIISVDFSVGVCIKCSEPLIESTYVPSSEDNNNDACIICKSCGEKNYAWYPENITFEEEQ